MKRYTVTLGASTTAGGKVILATANGSINSVQIALEDDLILCPACKSHGKIRCVGPRISETWNGKQVALENDLCVCGCPVPPKLIANQSLRYQVIDDTPAFMVTESMAQSVLADRSGSSTGAEITEQFFSMVSEDGQPVEGFRYDLYKDGEIHIRAAIYVDGNTVKIPADCDVDLVTWFNTDGATRRGG